MFRLCLAFGSPYIHPDVLRNRFTQRQLNDWIQFAEIEPFGGPTEDYRAAMAPWSAFMTRGGRKSLKVEDFVPKWSTEPRIVADYKARSLALLEAWDKPRR